MEWSQKFTSAIKNVKSQVFIGTLLTDLSSATRLWNAYCVCIVAKLFYFSEVLKETV